MHVKDDQLVYFATNLTEFLSCRPATLPKIQDYLGNQQIQHTVRYTLRSSNKIGMRRECGHSYRSAPLSSMSPFPPPVIRDARTLSQSENNRVYIAPSASAWDDVSSFAEPLIMFSNDLLGTRGIPTICRVIGPNATCECCRKSRYPGRNLPHAVIA